ncbi:MAG: riboflavin synthase [Prochlorothrix sp.]|nr:riboflavin synthase [Prochlorothrix sp.]
MFTGLVRGLGHLTFLSEYQVQIRGLSPAPLDFLGSLELGDSVAVDGICLTVESFVSGGFIAATSPETLHRTTLQQAIQGGEAVVVNLEPSLRVGDKLGGHFVTGHIDGVGQLVTATATDRFWELEFAVPSAAVQRYIVPKGSVAVNGISLTIADCSPTGDRFTVAVIPHTYHETNLQQLQGGSGVNLEGDILGKYVEKLLGYGGAGADRSGRSGESAPTAIDAAFLATHGYG